MNSPSASGSGQLTFNILSFEDNDEIPFFTIQLTKTKNINTPNIDQRTVKRVGPFTAGRSATWMMVLKNDLAKS